MVDSKSEEVTPAVRKQRPQAQCQSCVWLLSLGHLCGLCDCRSEFRNALTLHRQLEGEKDRSPPPLRTLRWVGRYQLPPSHSREQEQELAALTPSDA
jgi:hypothetical protein